MRVIATSTNPVRLSYLLALLSDAGLRPVLLDQHASLMDGSIGAIPQRIMVADGDAWQATRLLAEVGEA